MAVATAPRKKVERPKFFTGYGLQVARFAERNIVQTKGRWAGKPLHIEPWENGLLDELYLVDANGRRVYNEALVGLPRKNGKSTISAAIGLHGLVGTKEQGPEVYAAAASKDQARIVFQQAREFVENSPKLRQWLTPYRNHIVCRANNGIFRVLSSDAPLQHGLNPSLVVIDELHAHKDPELYYALTTGDIARLEPLIVSITTAGYDRETICWEVYQRGEALARKGGVDAMRKAGFLHYWLAASRPRESWDDYSPKAVCARPKVKKNRKPKPVRAGDRSAWQAANPSSWVTNKVLARKYERLPESVFRRLHLNEWTESEDAWIKPDDFDACKGRPRIDDKTPSWMAVDIGINRDARAIVQVQWHGKVLHVRHEIAVPKKDAPLSSAEARTRLLHWAERSPTLREVPFDPWSFRESAETLAEEHGLPMVQYDQTNSNMAPASQRLFELFKEQRLVHNGDEMFRTQILAAVASETERGWRISKRKSRDRIDAAVALAMAADRAVIFLIEGDDSIDPEDYRIQGL